MIVCNRRLYTKAGRKAAASRRTPKKCGLAAETREEPEEKRERGAENEASDDGKVESGVFAAMDDVARESTQAEGEFVAEIQKSAEENDEDAKEEERTAEFAQGIHVKIVEEANREVRS